MNEEAMARCEQDREERETDVWFCEECDKEECECEPADVFRAMGISNKSTHEKIANFTEAMIWGGYDKIPPCLKN